MASRRVGGQLVPAKDGMVWIVVEYAPDAPEGLRVGCSVEIDGNERGVGGYGLKETDPGVLKIKYVREEGRGQEVALAKASRKQIEDPHILPWLRMEGSTKRGRTWKEGVQDSVQAKMENFPLEGPQVGPWCMEFLLEHGWGPVDWSLFWKVQVVRLSDGDPGVEEHFSAAQALRDGAIYGQANLKNMAMLERIFRRMCYQEGYYRDRAEMKRETANGGGSASTAADPLVKDLFLGQRGVYAPLMVPPPFEKWTIREIADEAERKKNERKLREERQAVADRAKKK